MDDSALVEDDGILDRVENHEGTDDEEVVDTNKIKEPCVGMVFGSFEEAKSYYEEYGRKKGYATRIRSTYRDRHGPDMSSALLVCTCEGYNRKSPLGVDETKIKRSSTLRSGCKACMRVTNIKGTNAWKVTNFFDQHNHNLFLESKGVLLKYNGRKPRAGRSPDEDRRFNDVCRQTTRLAYMAGKSEEIYEVIMAVMEETFKKVTEMEKELLKNEDDERTSNESFELINSPGCNSLETMQSTDQALLLDQFIYQTKGKKRLRDGKEKFTGTDMLKSGHDMICSWQ